MKLGVLYHMPFWRGADGTLREVEGSFARYVDSLAPYFDEIVLCVPVLDRPRGEGTAIRSANVRLAPLPHFDGPMQFYPRVPLMMPALFSFVRRIDLLHCRLPTPAAVFAFAFARLLRRPAFVLIVGDLQALLPTLPYRGVKRALWRAYTAFEERNVQYMVRRSLAFANGAALAAKHTRANDPVVQTQTTTINAGEIASREDTCGSPRVRLLTVSRIDPRKGLRILPDVVRQLVAAGIDATLDIIGPPVGGPGEAERRAIESAASAPGVRERIALHGALPLDRLMAVYREYDIFVLPTLPGEGIPRVLLEAMASGLPVVTTRVAGIPSLVTEGQNGLLVDKTEAGPVAEAIARLVTDAPLRRRVIARGYETARAHTLETEAARMMQEVAARLGRRKICFVLPSLNGGGAERAAVNILNALDPAVWDRSMYLFRLEGPYLDALDAGIALAAGDSDSRTGRWLALRRFLRGARPHLVVSFLSYFTVLTAVRAAGIGARVVFNQQTPMSAFLEDADYQWRQPWHRHAFELVTRVGYRLADAIVTTSAGVADDLVARFGVARERISVLHNPVDLASIAAAASEPLDRAHDWLWSHPVIVAAGRLADAKNYPLLLDAFALLRARMPVKLFVLGEGERESALREQVDRLGLAGAVVFCGFQRNPWKYFARADVFALSSRYEGFGNVVIEAMACGVPVVATSSPGTREIVRDGVDGLLVDVHEPTALAAALEALLTDDTLRRRMSDEARRRALAFDVPAIAAAYGHMFAEAIA